MGSNYESFDILKKGWKTKASELFEEPKINISTWIKGKEKLLVALQEPSSFDTKRISVVVIILYIGVMGTA